MKENSKEKPLKRKKIKTKEEEKMPTLFNNIKRELTQNEYDLRAKNCVFFLRSPLSRQIVIEIKDDSKKKKKKKKRKTYYHLPVKSEAKNKTLTSMHNTHNKKENNSYINLQPRKIWLNCRRLYNKYLRGYNPDDYNKESLFQKFSKETLKENSSYNIALKKNIDSFPVFDKPMVNFSKKNERTKSLRDTNFVNKKLLFQSINLKVKYKPNIENNFVKCMNKTMSSNFINKGINDILEKRNLGNIGILKGVKFGRDTEMEEKKKKLKINLSYRFARQRLSLTNSQLPKLSTAKRMGISLDFLYKINSFYYSGTKVTKNLEDDLNNILEIIMEKGNLIIKKSANKKENLDYYKENQSNLNYFCLKNIFRLELFHIFGLVSGKGEEPEKCSRFLKNILISKLSDEKNYINNEILEKNQFKYKIDYILFMLMNDNFKFLKNIFNSLEGELSNMGINTETTGATFSLIIFIKDKVISAKIGDIHPYFVYNVFSEKSNNNLMIRNPHYEHNIYNILEQDRLEENRCEIKEYKNQIGKKDYKIEYKYDEEIQNLLNEKNIKFTRVIGYNKLNKIGINNKFDIQSFSMDVSKLQELQDEFRLPNRNNRNPHASDSEFYKIIKKKGINFTDIILKFVLIGNDELFDITKTSYYIKEINEAIIKDEIENFNKDNIKFCFNLKKIVKKLVNDSAEMNNKYMNRNNYKDLGLALVTLVES